MALDHIYNMTEDLEQESEHLDDIEDGEGCTEIWEFDLFGFAVLNR